MPSKLSGIIHDYLAQQQNPAKKEFGDKSFTLLFKRMRWRFVSQEQRTKDVREFIDSLSNEAFNQNIDMILLQVNTSKQECKNYPTSKDHVKAIIKRLPRLGDRESRLIEYVQKQRARVGTK